MNYSKILSALAFTFLTYSTAYAQTPAATATAQSTAKFSNESEVGMILVSGNADAQNYNFSQKSSYKWRRNELTLSGRFIKGFARGQENTRYWNVGPRFARDVNDRISLYTSYLLESDIFAGYDPRHNADLGAGYKILVDEPVKLRTELGYRFMRENRLGVGGTTKTFHLGRLFTEVEGKINDTLSAKLWVEYLPNFTATNDYMINGEPSLQISLTKIFSVKTAYLIKYRNVPAQQSAVRLDKIYTMSLIAKF